MPLTKREYLLTTGPVQSKEKHICLTAPVYLQPWQAASLRSPWKSKVRSSVFHAFMLTRQRSSTTKSATATPGQAPESQRQEEVLTLAQTCRDPYIVGELLLVIITLTAILSVDVLILLDNQDALHVIYATGANGVLFVMYCFSHAIRHQEGQ